MHTHTHTLRLERKRERENLREGEKKETTGHRVCPFNKRIIKKKEGLSTTTAESEREREVSVCKGGREGKDEAIEQSSWCLFIHELIMGIRSGWLR